MLDWDGAYAGGTNILSVAAREKENLTMEMFPRQALQGGLESMIYGVTKLMKLFL